MLKRSRCTPEQINRLLEIAIATTAASAAATTTIESIDAWNACLQRIIDASTPSINNSKQLKLLLRYALTGYNVGAGLPETMWALGKERVLDRLRGCIDYHKSIHE
jgi:hypothetical protein